ncbi:predicted protein [Thalassiosira pseudonana CCMP1335]|uniref:RING-type E3 ubiquitin transferase n=1 Tax=Thalassiosira pseudonana TaxID=35128 RepID=B8C7B5_THAPS|nr:predicted protein [Thalassiosira pseudonana CCMP1335]EED90718.1 predicted protein [Thalassiosira pseudonana CCMP1335]|eukprot:scaffold7546_cov189-Alexandrium_tamarense.AAC.2
MSNRQDAITALASPARPLCQFFVRTGSCRNDSSCRWSHNIGSLSRDEALKTIPCPHFAKGCCRFGDNCELKHDEADISSICGEAASENDDAICNICLENPTKLKRQFGILSCCNHVFCHKCLMEWRTEGSEEVSSRRVCPTCRETSDYVVPSYVLAKNDTEKQQIIRTYKERLAAIPCRKFDGILGSCAFGKDCFYQHLDGDGKDVKSHDKTMQELYEERERQRSSRRGGWVDVDMLNEMFMMLAAMRNRRRVHGRGDRDDSDEDEDQDDYGMMIPPFDILRALGEGSTDEDGGMDLEFMVNVLANAFRGTGRDDDSD